MRDLAWDAGYVVSRTELSPKECPYDNQLKVYQAIINNLIYHDPDPSIADTQGLEAFLEHHFFHTLQTLGIEQATTNMGLDLRVKLWLDTILRYKVESPSYRYAVYFYLQAVAEGNEEKKRLIGAWLRGETVLLRDLREFSITERIDRSVAFKMLRSLSQLVHELGYTGLVLLFDEGDRMVSISSSRTEKIACSLWCFLTRTNEIVFPSGEKFGSVSQQPNGLRVIRRGFVPFALISQTPLLPSAISRS